MLLQTWARAGLRAPCLHGCTLSIVGGVSGRFRRFLPPIFLWISCFWNHIAIIFININKFHKFWWLFESRINMCKIEPKMGEPQAGLPALAAPHHATSWRVTWAQDQVTPMWVWQISQDKAEWIEPSRVEVKSSDNPKNQSPIQLVKQCGPREQHVGATGAWAEPEPGRPA